MFEDELDDILLEGVDIEDIDVELDPLENSWNTLIDQIVMGNVIPVICPGVLTDKGKLHDILINFFIKKFDITVSEEKPLPTSFSELIFHPKFIERTKNDMDSIYGFINQILSKKSFPPSSLLQKIVSIKQFPFVITTTFTPIVEQAMRQVWGDELRVMCFSNNPAELQDISSEADLRKPTIFYMMGKAGAAAHRYVLTDTDMLDFCSSWVADTDNRPKNLVSALKSTGHDGKNGKYLLMLGNDYSDWLFRFIWSAIRKSNVNSTHSCYASKHEQDKLNMFLERNHAFMHKDPESVVDEIKKRLDKKLRLVAKTRFNKVEQDADIFISYSRSDSKIAEALYEHLTALGKRVWYDRNNITNGGRFMDEIFRGIDSARYFVPIFSSNIEKEKNDRHVYRQEWDRALTVQKSLGRTYIIPVAEQGIDYYRASINEELKRHNVIEYSLDADMEEIARKIVHTINQE